MLHGVVGEGKTSTVTARGNEEVDDGHTLRKRDEKTRGKMFNTLAAYEPRLRMVVRC